MPHEIDKFLPYPLPPWEHDFQTLAVHCEVDTASLIPFIPPPLELASDQIQLAVMRFDCQVPTRLYYDAAVIVLVRYQNTVGGFWPFAYNSTDQAMSGTREIWGYNMKLADIALERDTEFAEGQVSRLDKTVMSVSMNIEEKKFETTDMFPRLFLKHIPNAKTSGGIQTTVIRMNTRPEISSHITGSGKVSFEPSPDDPLYRIKIKKTLGATFTTGHQILPWGEIIS